MTDDDRIYFALRPDDEAAADVRILVEQLRRERGLRGAFTPPDKLHVSLNALGRSPDVQTIGKACAAVSAIAAAPFVISLNRLATFSGASGVRPLVLYGDEGVIGAHWLHDALHLALTSPGVARGAARQFEPHMTLAWAAPEFPEEFLTVPVTWMVREFVLIRSAAGRHETLGRWPLSA